MIVGRSIVGMMTIISISATPFEENRVSQIMNCCKLDLISRQS